MRNKILNCQNFVFHNVTLRFSHHALSTFISPPRELTNAYRCLDHFSSTACVLVKTIAKLNFLKYRVLEPRTAQNPRPRRAEAKAKDNTVKANVKDFTNLSLRPRTSSRTTSLLVRYKKTKTNVAKLSIFTNPRKQHRCWWKLNQQSCSTSRLSNLRPARWFQVAHDDKFVNRLLKCLGLFYRLK